MKNIVLFLPFLLLLSCSVQKRKYQNGYYVEWNHKKETHTKTASVKETTKKNKPTVTHAAEIEVSTGDKPNLMADVRHTFSDLLKKKVAFLKAGEDTCDLLIFKDGSEIRSKVSEVGINEIKYKRCDAPDGPVYVARKSDIFMIKYANGTKEVIKSAEPAVAVTPYQSQSSNVYKSNKYKRENHPLALPSLILGSLSVITGYFLGLYALYMGVMSAFLVIPMLLGVIAVALGITAMNRIKEQPDVYKGKGMAMPGMIMGLVIACIYAMIFFFYFLFTI